MEQKSREENLHEERSSAQRGNPVEKTYDKKWS